MGKRELVALINLSSWCLVIIERLFLAVPRGYLRFVIVVFPDYTHLLFLYGRLVVGLRSISHFSIYFVCGGGRASCADPERVGGPDPPAFFGIVWDPLKNKKTTKPAFIVKP